LWADFIYFLASLEWQNFPGLSGHPGQPGPPGSIQFVCGKMTVDCPRYLSPVRSVILETPISAGVKTILQ